MWIAAAGDVTSNTGDVWGFLIVVATLLFGSGGVLRWRSRRREADVDAPPIARRVVTDVETLLTKRVKQLEREQADMERRHHAERVAAEQQRVVMQNRVEALISDLATCRAELTAERRPRPTPGGDPGA